MLLTNYPKFKYSFCWWLFEYHLRSYQRFQENQPQQRLERINQNKNKPHWKKYDAQMINFPTLTEEDVQNICFGNWYIGVDV